MKIWYLIVDHIPIGRNGAQEGAPVPWVHGANGSYIPPDMLCDDFLQKNGYKTRAAAIRGGKVIREKCSDNFWGVGKIEVKSAEVPDGNLRYKIYKCYEIVIEDSEGNEVGNCNYCYGTKAEAEDMARHELKIAMMEREGK